MNGGEQFVARKQVLAVAGVEIFERHVAFTAHAGERDACAEGDQQRHRVANRRAIGDVAAQRSRVAHGHACKARGETMQLRPVLDQRVERIRQRDRCADADLLAILRDAAQFLGAGDVQNLRVLLVLFGDPQAHVGGASGDQRVGMCGACGEQFLQVVRCQIACCIGRAGGVQRGQLLEQFALIHLHARQFAHALRRVEDGAVAGAAAQVAREFFHRQLARDGLAFADMVLVHAEHAHHKAGRAEAALRAVAVHHGLLGGVQIGVVGAGGLDQRIAGQIFCGPQRHAVDGMGQANAAVDGLVVHCAIALGAQHDGAGSAVAFAAAFLGACAAQVFTQNFQQRAVGRDAVQCHDLAATDKAQGAGVAHGGLVSSLLVRDVLRVSAEHVGRYMNGDIPPMSATL